MPGTVLDAKGVGKGHDPSLPGSSWSGEKEGETGFYKAAPRGKCCA